MTDLPISADMTINDLEQWARLQRERLRRDAPPEQSNDLTFVLAQTAKLTEEVGELSAEILGHAGYQRAAKGKAFDAESIGSELADVMICTAILAVQHNVDLGKALTKKIEKINTRYDENAHLFASPVQSTSEFRSQRV